MKITIIAIGSRGDVQPFIGLGQVLQTQGHVVKIVALDMFDDFVRQAGLAFDPIHVANPLAMIEEVAEGGQYALQHLMTMMRALKAEALQAFEEGLATCAGADVMLYSPLGLSIAISAHEKFRIPMIGAFLQPFHPTAEFPFLLLTQRNLGRRLNRLSYFAVWLWPWLSIRGMLNRWRRERLDLPPLPLDFLNRWLTARNPALCAFSPLVVPRPADWGAHLIMTGYWFFDEAAQWQPPAELVDFLAAGPPPVCIGFGSMKTRDPERLTAIVLAALARTRQRAIFLTGWGGLSHADLPEQVLKLTSAPHDWLFPRMAAVIHHGGAGTTAAGLRAGVPTVVTPFLLDQYFWGDRVFKLGVGPVPLPRRTITVERLAAAITQALSDTAMRQRAAALGEKIRAEQGIANAAAFFSSICERLQDSRNGV